MRFVRRSDAGSGQPRHVLTSPAFRIATAVLAAVVAVWALVLRPAGEAVARPLLLVSGRDDHGALAQAEVALLDGPDGSAVGTVPDGTLVEVLGTRGEWIEVRAIVGAPVDVAGWVNDFFLRGQVHVVADPPACPVPLAGEPGATPYATLRPSEQVVLVDHHLAPDGLWVGVQPLQDDAIGLVPFAWVRELPGPVASEGEACEDVTLDPEAVPHQHG